MTVKYYLDNPYIRTINAKVVSKVFKDGKYYLKLDRTIFYPHLSGGQPGDIGTINDIPLEEVYEKDDDIIHVVNKNIDTNHVKLKIQWKNRLDNMQQHTGQHLLSAAFSKLYNADTIGFHLGRNYVYIDLNMNSLSKEESKRIEMYANKIITSNFEIKSYYIEKNQVNNIPLRKDPTVDTNLRIIEIDNIDFSPCGGTHLKNTGEIGIIKIRSWENYKGNIRVEFVCGERALIDYTWKNEAINNISSLLSAKDIDSFEKVNLFYQQKLDLEKENRNLREELNMYKAEDIYQSAFKIKNNIYVSRIFEDTNLKDLIRLTNHLSNKRKFIQIYGLKDIKSDLGQFLVKISDDLKVDLKSILNDISNDYEIKGGGTNFNVQGKVPAEDLEEVMTRFFEAIKSN